MSFICVADYREKLDPTSILQLLPEDILREVIRGLHYKFRRGVVLVYATLKDNKWIVDRGNRVEVIDPDFGLETEEEAVYFSEACRFIRDLLGKEWCRDCDRTIAKKRVEANDSEPGPYRCWAGMGELVYPLSFGGGVRAVLLAGGQMVPECDDEGVVALKHIILSRPQGEDEWNRFHAALEREREKRQVIELCKDARLEILKRLGSSLQTIINDLYEARRGAATKEVLQKSAAAISNADLSSSDLWWQHVAPLFREFCSLTHLKEIQVYTRRHSRFERWVPYITKASERKRLAVRNVACHFEGSDWICVKANEGSFRSLLDLLELRDETVHLFRTEHRPVGTALSTLFVIRGQITDSNRQLIREFCTAVGTRTDVASMIFRMSEAQTNYRISVGAIAHSFRMPLQTILSDLHDLAELPGLEENRMDQRLSDSIDRVIDARMDIKILLEEASEQREDIEVSGFVSRITDDFQAMAVRKHCEIIPKEPWASGMVVRANGYRLNRAIANLIDNAVKYSWNDHEIWVWVECYGTYARIRISNYGIGIPPDTRERIMQLGVRGEVPDSGHERSGSGWGLAIANSTFVDHGGWLDVESFPDDNVTTRKPGEEYHRYITEVRAYLPLK